MEYHEFLDRVMREAGFDDPGMAKTISKAVLGTLGELLTQTGRHHFEAQLPKELKEYVRQWQGTIDAEKMVPRLSTERIINRIQARSELNHSETIRGISAVMKVLQDAVSSGEIRKIQDQLVTIDALMELEK